MTIEEAKSVIAQGKPPSLMESRKAGLSFEEFAQTAIARNRYSDAEEVIAAANRPAPVKAKRSRRRRGCGCDNAPDCLCSIWMR